MTASAGGFPLHSSRQYWEGIPQANEGSNMEFELDRDGRTNEGERYYVYAIGNGKKRCIGQAVRADRTGLWAAYADGERLAWAETAEEAARKLFAFAAARRPEVWGRRAEKQGVEERFARLRRRIPRQADAAEWAVRSVRFVPIERRARLREDVADLIEDLEAQLMLWRIVKKELSALPKLFRYK